MSLRGYAFDSAYKAGYSVLSCLPEEAAIKCGQWILKHLPLERLGPSVKTPGATIAGVSLPSPVILASYYKDAEIWEKALALGFGAVTTKTATIRYRSRKPGTVARYGKGFVNCEAYPNYGLEGTKRNLDRFLCRYSGAGKLIVSIGAIDWIDEYIELARQLHEYADFIEVNGSSPNNQMAYNMARNDYCIEKVSRGVRDACTKPVIWKVSPDYPDENRRAVIPK